MTTGRSLVLGSLLALLLSACGGDSEPTASSARSSSSPRGRETLTQVRSLLERGADVEARDPTGATALVAAAYGNHLEAARLLVEAGADVNAKDDTQQSAYLIATSEVGDDPRLLELTLRNGADVKAKDSYNGTGLIRAAERGHAAIVGRLLETSDRSRSREPARLDGAPRGDHPRRGRRPAHRGGPEARSRPAPTSTSRTAEA